MPGEVIDDLLMFKVPPSSLDCSTLLCVSLRIVREAGELVSAVIGSFIVGTGGFVCFNIVGRPLYQASFGLFQVVISILFVSPLLSMMDKIGIKLSLAYGNGETEGCKKAFSQGCASILIAICCMCLPTLLGIKHILLALGIDYRIVDLVHESMHPFMLVVIVQTVSETIRAFCLSQGMESTLGRLAICNNILSIFTNWYMIVYLDLGIKGWVYTDLIYETINLVGGVWTMQGALPGSIGYASIKDTLDGFGCFFWESIKFMLGNYSEFIGYELTSIYIAMVGNNDSIGAYAGIVNFGGIIYRIGITFAITCRTRVNILIGAHLPNTARNFFRFTMLVTLIIGMILSALVYVCREYIIKIYADSTEDVEREFNKLLSVYTLFIPSAISQSISYVGMKSTDSMGVLLLFNVLIVLGVNGTLGLYLCLHGYSLTVLFALLLTLVLIVNVLSFLYSTEINDWGEDKDGNRIIDDVV